MSSKVSRKRILEHIQQSPFAVSVEWSYPASPPLGFAPPKADMARVEEVFVRNTDGSKSSATVLRNIGKDRDVASELPGGLIHLTSCGEIRSCHIFKKEKTEDEHRSPDYVRTTQMVAIKMDNRDTMRQLHNDKDRWDHRHHPFPENPWKEVSALQLIHSNRIGTKDESTNIVSLLDVLYDEECLYEFLPFYHTSLYWWIHREHSQIGLGEDMSRHFFVQLIHAIHVIHSKGICHRDISSHNILLDETNQNMVLIDFGMCLRVPYNYPDDHYTEDVTEVSSFSASSRRLIHCQSHCGKLRFMAPEIYAKQDFDGLSVDLWSVAVVLFEMITGKVPYQTPCDSDPGYHDLMDAYFYWNTKAVDPCLSWGHQVSDELVDLLKCMFRPDPKDRLSLAEVAAHPWVNQWVNNDLESRTN